MTKNEYFNSVLSGTCEWSPELNNELNVTVGDLYDYLLSKEVCDHTLTSEELELQGAHVCRFKNILETLTLEEWIELTTTNFTVNSLFMYLDRYKVWYDRTNGRRASHVSYERLIIKDLKVFKYLKDNLTGRGYYGDILYYVDTISSAYFKFDSEDQFIEFIKNNPAYYPCLYTDYGKKLSYETQVKIVTNNPDLLEHLLVFTSELALVALKNKGEQTSNCVSNNNLYALYRYIHTRNKSILPFRLHLLTHKNENKTRSEEIEISHLTMFLERCS